MLIQSPCTVALPILDSIIIISLISYHPSYPSRYPPGTRHLSSFAASRDGPAGTPPDVPHTQPPSDRAAATPPFGGNPICYNGYPLVN